MPVATGARRKADVMARSKPTKSTKSSVDRRDFLKGAALAGTATLAASPGTIAAQSAARPPLLALFSPALAQEPTLPFPGAKKVKDNGYAIIWDVTFQPGKSTGMVTLPLHQAAVFLTDGAVKYTKTDGSWSIEHNKIGSVRYASKGTVEAVEGASGAPVRAMVFQISDKVPPKITPQTGIPDKFPRDNAVELFQTDRVVVYDYTWKKGMITKLHLHYRMDAGVWIAPGQTPVSGTKAL